MKAESLLRTPVSVIVVNYNAGALLRDCVCSALEQASEVIVVDNGSRDDSLAQLEGAFPDEARLQIVRTGANLGFAGGCNIGLARAIQNRLLFLNPDCVLGEGSLARLLEVLDASPEAGMVGGLLLNPDGSEQGGGRRAIPTPWRSFVRAFGLTRLSKRWPGVFVDFHLHKHALPAEPVEVEAISGALMLVKREAVNAVGAWDEDYFLHCEDLDWCVRFTRAGWKILFVPDAKVIHQKGACSRSRPFFVEWHKHNGMRRFYRKFFRERYPLVLMWLVEAGVWLRLAAVTLVHGLRKLLRRAR